jgi:hypothetical protein
VTDKATNSRATDVRASNGQATVDLALQVANVAAQVSAARRSADESKCQELESRLALAQTKLLERQSTPEGLILFLEVMRGLLRGDDVSALAGDLPTAYRAVYEQLVSETGDASSGGQSAAPGAQEGTMTVRQVLDEVSQNVILALTHGTFDQQRRMAETLLAMEQESLERPDLVELRTLLQALRLLLKGQDPTPVAERLRGPFQARWQEILGAIQE